MRRFASGLHFAECPRWHQGQLWMSDIWGRTVYRFDIDGTRHSVQTFDDDPGGLGWLPDGRLLVVGMERRVLYRVEPSGPVVHADLTPFAPWPCNDMITAEDGAAYVTQFGYDVWGGTTPVIPAPLLRVSRAGGVDVVAGDLLCPNGIALSADGRTLMVAEPAGSRITRFSVQPDGSRFGPAVCPAGRHLPRCGQRRVGSGADRQTCPADRGQRPGESRDPIRRAPAGGGAGWP
jgi:sugar lactone lactonase YvrE